MTRKTSLLIVAGVLVVAAASVGAYFVWAHAHAPIPALDRDFRFDQVYIGTGNGSLAANTTTLRVDVWFSNTGPHAMRDLRLVAVAIESARNLVVDTQEHSLGPLAARHTTNTTWTMPLNASHEYRIEILVLLDGLLVARGQGSVGFGGYYLEADGNADAERTRAVSASEFRYDYLVESR